MPLWTVASTSPAFTHATKKQKTKSKMTEGTGLSAQVGELKEEGNKFFRAAEYLKAAAAYTKAIKLAGKDGASDR